MCYEKPGGLGHLPLSMPVSKLWADMIARGEATIDEAPSVILIAMMDTKNKKKEAQQPPHHPLLNLPQNSPNTMPQVVYNFGAPSPGIQQYPSGMAVFSAAAPPIEPRSSPPQRDGDDDNNMRIYFNWLAIKFPTHGPRFLEIKGVVTENGWGFSDLKGCTDNQWNAMEVPPGFVAKIRKHLKDFAHLPTIQARLSDDAASPTNSLSA